MGLWSQEDVDARIAGLTAHVDAMGTSLAELDGDVTLKLLASAALSGRTAAEWGAVAPKIPLLWGYYGALKDKAAEIVALRGTRPRLKGEQLDELGRQLGGDSVVVPPDPNAPGTRTLTAAPGETRSIAWVDSAMSAMFQQIVSVVDRVGAAWTALPRIEQYDATLTGLIQTAGQNGLKPPAEVAAVRSVLGDLRTRIKADPLAADLSGLDAAAGRVATAGQLLQAAIAARGQMAGRLAAAGGGLDAAAALITQAGAVRAEASEKIAGVANGPADTVALGERLARLRTNLDSITTLARADWQEAARLLGQLEQQVATLSDDASASLAACRDPLEARNELRGRLDAYHAKALAVGRAEDDTLTRMYEAAKALLYTAPCDVAGAEAAVRAYQQGLNQTTTTR